MPKVYGSFRKQTITELPFIAGVYKRTLSEILTDTKRNLSVSKQTNKYNVYLKLKYIIVL